MTRLVALAVALLALGALAQEGKKDQQQPTTKPQVIIFGPGEAIHGDRESPDGIYLDVPPRTVFPRFFKVRDNFNDKLMNSVNEM